MNVVRLHDQRLTADCAQLQVSAGGRQPARGNPQSSMSAMMFSLSL